MKKIFLVLLVLFSVIYGDECEITFKSLYENDDVESLFVRASRLEEYCKYKDDKKACKCYDEYISYCKDRCEFGSSLHCKIIATMLGYKNKDFLKYLEKGCRSSRKDSFTADLCVLYGGFLKNKFYETNYLVFKLKARDAFKRACMLGDKKACQSAEELK